GVASVRRRGHTVERIALRMLSAVLEAAVIDRAGAGLSDDVVGPHLSGQTGVAAAIAEGTHPLLPAVAKLESVRGDPVLLRTVGLHVETEAVVGEFDHMARRAVAPAHPQVEIHPVAPRGA